MYVTSQFLGKNLKIMHIKSCHHFMHSFIFAMHNFNLTYYVLLIKSFSVCSDSRGNLLFHKFKIVLNLFGAFGNFHKRKQKRKRERKRKKNKKAPGTESSPRPKTAQDLFPSPSRTVIYSLSSCR
jgi:hypothetical protein